MLAKRPRKREIICLCKKSCGRQNFSQADRVVQFGGLNLDWMKITLKMGMFFLHFVTILCEDVRTIFDTFYCNFLSINLRRLSTD